MSQLEIVFLLALFPGVVQDPQDPGEGAQDAPPAAVERRDQDAAEVHVLGIDAETQASEDYGLRKAEYDRVLAASPPEGRLQMEAVAVLAEGAVEAHFVDPTLDEPALSEEIYLVEEFDPVHKHDTLPVGTLFVTGLDGRVVLHLGRDVQVGMGPMGALYIRQMEYVREGPDDEGYQLTHVRVINGNVKVYGVKTTAVERDGQLIHPVNKWVSTPDLTLSAPGTQFEAGWSAFDGSYIRDVDTTKLLAVTLEYFQHELPLLLAARDSSSSRHPAPAAMALYKTVFPPPSPAFEDSERDHDGQVENGFVVFRDDYTLMNRQDCNLCDELIPPRVPDDPKPPTPRTRPISGGLPKGSWR